MEIHDAGQNGVTAIFAQHEGGGVFSDDVHAEFGGVNPFFLNGFQQHLPKRVRLTAVVETAAVNQTENVGIRAGRDGVKVAVVKAVGDHRRGFFSQEGVKPEKIVPHQVGKIGNTGSGGKDAQFIGLVAFFGFGGKIYVQKFRVVGPFIAKIADEGDLVFFLEPQAQKECRRRSGTDHGDFDIRVLFQDALQFHFCKRQPKRFGTGRKKPMADKLDHFSQFQAPEQLEQPVCIRAEGTPDFD